MIDLNIPCIQTVELRYIGDASEQQKILQACHIDTTAGHMGEKKTIARISERFVWPGVVKAVKQMVWTFCCVTLGVFKTCSIPLRLYVQCMFQLF